MADIHEALLSNDFHDYIFPSFLLNSEEFTSEWPELVTMRLNDDFSLGMYPSPSSDPNEEQLRRVRYSSLPKLFTLLDTVSLQESGIVNSQSHPYLSLTGEGVLIGFIDTGINYLDPVFQNSAGRTRIIRLWDQTVEGGTAPLDFPYGSEYTQDEINDAIQSDNPYDVVPSVDTNGHGTFMASVAAGSAIPEGDFTGAAPEASIAVVKLRECKPYLKDYFLISGPAPAYQESDLIAALSYLQDLARKMFIPNVMCLGIGTNYGSHTGLAPLALSFGQPMYFTSNANIVAAGNEALEAHHYLGSVKKENISQPVEILVQEGSRGFTLELWGQAPEIFSIGFASPSGEIIQRIPSGTSRHERVTFYLDATVIYVTYEAISQLILMRFVGPSPGIWKVNVYASNIIRGEFHMWLPINGFTSPDVVFMTPNPYTTITSPSDSSNVITTGAYDAYNRSLFVQSGRGLTRAELMKPDLCAPGVNVYGKNQYGDYTRRTGTSVSAAITAGGVALIMQWSFARRQPPIRFNNSDMKNILIRGARRNPLEVYPNREWGYGELDIFSSFTVLTNP